MKKLLLAALAALAVGGYAYADGEWLRAGPVWLKGLVYTGTSKVALTNAAGNLSTTTGAYSGNVSVGGTLSVTGVSTVSGITNAGNITSAGNSLVGGTLGVTGAVSLQSTLAVAGRSTFSTYESHTFGTATAGTTQTQAGATELTKTFNKVTTGNANDGVALPSGSFAACLLVSNISANALKVYGNNSDDDTIDGGSADASVTQAASAKSIWYCTSNGVAWTSFQ